MSMGNRICHCQNCGKEIIWIRMPGGKRIPCDTDLLTYKQVPEGEETIITPNGEVINAEIMKDGSADATGLGYRLHAASCSSVENR